MFLGGSVVSGDGRDNVRNIETVIATDHDDVIRGSSGPDNISGGLGHDDLYGLAGDERLHGSAGTTS